MKYTLLILACSLILSGCTAPSGYSRYGSNYQPNGIGGSLMPRTSQAIARIQNRYVSPQPPARFNELLGQYSSPQYAAQYPALAQARREQQNWANTSNPTQSEREEFLRWKNKQTAQENTRFRRNMADAEADREAALQSTEKLPWESEPEYRARLQLINQKSLSLARKHNELANQAEQRLSNY